MEHPSENDFSLYRKLIIAQLERLESGYNETRREIEKNRMSIAIIKAQTALIATIVSVSIGIGGLIMKLLN